MSDVGELQADGKGFLEPYLPQHACNTTDDETLSLNSRTSNSPRRPSAKHGDLPFVTLAYASSLDSMIALAPGARTTLSGPETKCMTHFLRLRHDAILIGAGTAVTDDPGLNCRYPGATLVDQPQPVIVDPNGRWTVQDKKATRLAIERAGKAPWVVARQRTASAEPLEAIGGKVLLFDQSALDSASQSDISWHTILRQLKQNGIESVMIEGGATVINALLALPDLVDAVIITIAPTFLGQGGVAVSPPAKGAGRDRTNAAWLQQTSWRQFGNDVVLCGRLAT
ncbi:2,5-diamino-6-ribosylamino-4(3H)-pyrimidinone 5'-phosphate reductase [Fulvia fulva]|uniref:2,5-diamino-6-ribosylamino-4(3H)-pyrimidinone 5'-phosphate reductase n=1 Tax=Passalora fulva TaxID=5499 RepID=A0A9Q8P7N9_PASFU|nr:2,5-diamino-6-ribosylamino-4(3H)-pyrimidinone 5'-phosphate reductase [Fulvia fulva]KAK4626670.1 2,5-diamino-6-ribosylamino-4(3H)-pyrimidinone 5'-phosphate reductase [Fulvia fulva]KAK4627845.1 2,5-diamino-6-ribosylamino-4(3H)-pyrimidinone 5'-phosphate reductase [Fulvia fulva]UJO16231.1 2,5-diamino-6-ribosylamino-4(3H)-pyrimidinone 5'-phosphate reductase [Fulvia fulva]WPV13482.1 2,5-diamino-6-ribosylamino-4(3H)-pyrimidinone 5'-phosphate reductase [Fulvia fulva]WPV29169.1 2,5-diamino-6-ribosyl